MMTAGLAAPPRYFPRDAEINRRGARSLSEVEAPPQLDRAAARKLARRGATLLDVREPAAFLAGHAKGAVNVGLGGQFASWCGTLLSMDEPIVLIAADENKAVDAVARLARVGMENVVGWTLAQKRASARIPQISARALADAPQPVLDVRRRGEFESGHIPGATNLPLDELPQRLDEVPRNGALAVVCAGGYRSSMACSLLARAGVTNLANVTGGTAAWVQEGLPTEA